MKMNEKIKNAFSHRVIYAGLAATYFAGWFGIDKAVIYQSLTVLYAMMVIKG